MGHVLRPYQREALAYARPLDAIALFLDMRLGKSLITIRALRYRASVKRILVVAPYSALDGWVQELRREGQSFVMLGGSRGTREAELLGLRMMKDTPERIWVLTNKESHLSVGRELTGPRWDGVVLDESTFVKSPAAQVTKYWTKFPRHDGQVRVILTGTPAPEGALNYWTQLRFLDPGILGYKSYYDFRAKRFHPVGYDWVMNTGAKEWLASILAKHTYQLKRTDVNLGGVKIYETRICQLPANVRKIYNTVEAEFVLEGTGSMEWKTKIAGVKHSWCRMLAGGFMPDKYQQAQQIAKHKLALLLSLLSDELKNEPVVIWAQYRAEVETIAKALGVQHIHGDVPPVKRTKIVHDFQSGKRQQYLVCQPETMKFGVHMDRASTMIYYSTTESSLTRQQTEDRIIDAGKTGSVLIIDLVTEDTIDEDVQESLENKENGQQIMQRMIRKARERQSV